MKKIPVEGAVGELRAAPFDLSNVAGAEALFKEVPHVDILVNNLGIYEEKTFEEITDIDWLRMFDINVLSGIRLSRYYFPKMKTSRWGRIVFISSESALNIPVEMIHYGVTKTAMLALSRGLAETTTGTGVTVNAVLPGPTYTSGVAKFVSEIAQSKKITPKEVERDFFKTVRPSSIIQRFATPDEIAALVAFVCSEKASAINGAGLRVDGGVVRFIV